MSFDDSPRQEEPEAEDSPGLYRQAWFFYLILASAGVIWLGSHHGRLSLDLFVDLKSWWIDIALGLGAAFLLVGLWHAAKRFIPTTEQLEERIRELIGPIDESEAFALALLSGFSEELLFRGAMQSSWGWIWATLIFGLMHTGPGREFRFWTVFAMVAGGLFAALTLYRGTILAAIVAHISVNAIHLRRMTLRPAQAEGSEST